MSTNVQSNPKMSQNVLLPVLSYKRKWYNTSHCVLDSLHANPTVHPVLMYTMGQNSTAWYVPNVPKHLACINMNGRDSAYDLVSMSV